MEGSESSGRKTRPLWRGPLAAAVTEGAAREPKAEAWPGRGARSYKPTGEDSKGRVSV